MCGKPETVATDDVGLEDLPAKTVIPASIDVLHSEMLSDLTRERRATDVLFPPSNQREFKAHLKVGTQ
jgi:hypothetical protein